ncbi:MAG: NadS family protein [Rickettsiales bacterium]|nr:NadS family protein [Pseudomonadota bacterium]MDA0967442.1 NadS family protein [Pseudomonadota bacterium]MDG4544190.1 NadS family protein [Rickettsiales bacterium]MDG4546371.1 NadS family protein [Rickettsiales bacterium]MDG4548514.1 NadS family protein [Rickettsiales bacterium]
MPNKTLFEDIKEGLEEAIAFNNGKDTGAYIIMPEEVDVKAIREKLKMTQAQFSESFDIPITTLRKWEQHQRKPERLARAFLKVLDHSPQTVIDALHS